MHYSTELRDRVFVKSNGFLLFTKHMSKNVGKIYKQTLKQSVNTARNGLIMLNNLLKMHLKVL